LDFDDRNAGDEPEQCHGEQLQGARHTADDAGDGARQRPAATDEQHRGAVDQPAIGGLDRLVIGINPVVPAALKPRIGDAVGLVQITQIRPEVVVLLNLLLVAHEVGVIDLVEPHQRREQTDVRLGGSDGIELDRQTDELEVVSSWNDTSNSQAIVVEGNVASNTESTTQTFATTSTLKVDLRLSRYGSRTGETPTSGFKQQEVLGVELRSKSSGATAAGTRSVEFSSTVGKNTINGKTLREGGVINGSSAVLTESLLADVLIEKDVTTAITELWRFRNGDLPVNTSNLDPEIVDFEAVDEGDVTDSEHFLVEIKDGEAQ